MVGEFNGRSAGAKVGSSHMIRQRVLNLTDAQRKHLAAQLKEQLPDTGTLVAWYTSTDGRELTPSELRGHAMKRLSKAVVPRFFQHCDSLPHTSTGKIDRRRTLSMPVRVRSVSRAASHEPLQKAGTASALPQVSSSEQSDLLEKLRAIWTEVLGTRQFSVDDNFFEIGGDSLGLIKVIALSSECGISVTPGQMYESPTLRQLAQTLDQKAGTYEAFKDDQKCQTVAADSESKTDRQFETADGSHAPVRARITRETGQTRPVCLSSKLDRSPLFFLPPQGVAVGSFRHVVAELFEFSCFAPVTLDANSANTMTVKDLAHQFLDQIKLTDSCGPYRLIGTCEGAYVAWEVAQMLTAERRRVDFLGIIDTPNPDAMIFRPLADRLRQRWQTLKRDSPWSVMRQLLIRGSSWLRRRFREAVSRQKHLTRAGSRMGWQYSPQPYSGRATLFRAGYRAAITDFDADFANGWGDLPRDGLDVFTLPCTRPDMLEPPFAAKLAQQIRNVLQS